LHKHKALSINPSTAKKKKTRKKEGIQAWWYTPIISALMRQRQEGYEFKVKLGYMAKLFLKK
jgi:hypothetical protein